MLQPPVMDPSLTQVTPHALVHRRELRMHLRHCRRVALHGMAGSAPSGAFVISRA